jgi:hypothetical protein
MEQKGKGQKGSIMEESNQIRENQKKLLSKKGAPFCSFKLNIAKLKVNNEPY